MDGMDYALAVGQSNGTPQQLIEWIIQYTSQIDAVGSLVLTLVIIGIYLRQHQLLRTQTKSMQNQTDTMQAGISPLLRVDDNIGYLETHPHRDGYSNPGYLGVTITNVGNETAKNLEILTTILGDVAIPDANIQPRATTLNPQSRPVVTREGTGGAIPKEETEDFYAAVEVQIDHPTVSDNVQRVGNALGTLDTLQDSHDQSECDGSKPAIENPRIAFAIRYENMAGESTVLPIRNSIEIDLSAPSSNLQQVMDNRSGTEVVNDVFGDKEYESA
jgi:hypothetical protein